MARANSPPMAEPPIPATMMPPGLSHGSSPADSTFHSASRRCSGMARMSVSWSDASTRAIVSRSSASPSVVDIVVALLPLASSERDRPVGQLRLREDSHACGQDVARPHRDALAEHRAAGHDAALADARAGADDAVLQPAARADLGAVQHHRTLDRRPLAGPHALAEPDEAADVRAVLDPAAALDDRRRHDAPLGLDVVADVDEVGAEALGDRGLHVALEDVEGALQVALGGAEVEPVGVGREPVQPRTDEPRPDLALDRDLAVGLDEVEHPALEHVGARRA